ncbi:hypothetical protein OH77DRAFT_1520716 [Trametes cingulata]|nr:hypothetical protein OH77DRAFT_1520716 [Trametes cingulata]
MPWDILVEVFVLLSPQDLLALARTSKGLRAFLMDRKNASVWKKARLGTDGIPERPPQLSEPLYAEFLFGTSCLGCGEQDIERTFWALCGRWCPSCEEKRIVHSTAIGYLTAAVRKETRCEHEVIPYACLIEYPDFQYTTYFDRREAKRFKARWKLCKTQAEKKQLVEECSASVKEQQKRARAFEAWGQVVDQRRAQERVQRCKARAAAYIDILSQPASDCCSHIRYSIVERLKTEGWADEIRKMRVDQLEKLYKLDDVNKPIPLTEDDWNDMKQRLFTHMEAVRTARLQVERYRLTVARLEFVRQVVAAYEDSLGPRDDMSDLRAEFADLAQLAIFRDLVEAPLEGITKESFYELRNVIPALQEEWYSKRKSEFEELVRKRRNLRTDVEPLSLAIVSFDCKRCNRQKMRWPNVLAHRCGRGVDYTPESRAYMHAVLDVCKTYHLPGPWRRPSAFEVSFAPADVEDVIRMCGYDPLRVTYEELQTGIRLYCKICSVPSLGYMVVYDWTNAASHLRPLCDVRDTVFGPPADVKAKKWTILDAEHTAKVLAVEAARRAAGDVPNAIFGCTRCRYRSRGFPESHCVGVHNIKCPRIGQDFYLHPETEFASQPITIYPEDARGDRTAAKDVKRGHAFFSPSLFKF